MARPSAPILFLRTLHACRWRGVLSCLGAVLAIAGSPDAQRILNEAKINGVRGGLETPLDLGDHFGHAVVWLSDLDGDGLDELAVAANLDDDGGQDRGAVYVLFLGPQGKVLRERKISFGRGGFVGELDDLDAFGHSMAGLGDFDRDGIEDLLVGARGDDDGGTTGTGAAWILFLRRDGTVRDHAKISALSGGFQGGLDDRDNFGWAVASLGDLDGDGVTDVAVSAPADDDGGENRGAVWILFLNADASVRAHAKISQTAGDFPGDLADGDFFGRAVAPLGDLDGDGVVDLAVGAAQDDTGGPDAGAVWILFLKPDGHVKAASKIAEGVGGFTGDLDPSDVFGMAAASAGDVDGDGVVDLAVGALNDDDGTRNAGAVWLLFLRTDGTVIRHEKISAESGGFSGSLGQRDWFGRALVTRPDPNGPGSFELAVGAVGDSEQPGGGRGAVWILSLAGRGRAGEALVRQADPAAAPKLVSRCSPRPGHTFAAWISVVDHPAARWTWLAGSMAPVDPAATPWGAVLVDSTRVFFTSLAGGSDLSLHLLEIPADPALEGARAYTQGLILGGGLALTNALDLTLGSL